MQDFLLNTDYSADKIVWLKEGTINANAGSNDITLSHSFGVNLFVRGVFSRDNFQTAYEFGTEKYMPNSLVLDFNSYIVSDTSEVLAHITLNSSSTVQYRLWGVVNEAETQNLDISGTASDTTNEFIVNTKYNLPRLYAEGYANPDTDYIHSLGFIPYVDVWAYGQYMNKWTLLPVGIFGSAFLWGSPIKVDTSKISFTSQNPTYTNFYYRVYV
jgi:hypothetical protein